MNVKELIAKLETLPDDTLVKTWRCYTDTETDDVYVSTDGKGTVWIMDSTIGYEAI
jgi:hypothetical protein